ncbi:hypothetical protein DKW60_09060 [Leucothrix pacifica]|uniref:Type II toxin-antitoxin system HigB family toxin n=2 Tax=Leucothrix pacifica TaxID=1247513 RepID=A0A317CHG6_9GAMM|nr:hypothetical protein DKW60_09060 [Leucothrix pacifica]
MIEYPQWKIGMDLWISTFNNRELDVRSYKDIKDAWQQASGWNTDRISGKRLKNEDGDYGTVYDLYIFDIHGNDCRLLAKINGNIIFIRGIFSHAEYDKWCKQNIHQGKLKR